MEQETQEQEQNPRSKFREVSLEELSVGMMVWSIGPPFALWEGEPPYIVPCTVIEVQAEDGLTVVQYEGKGQVWHRGQSIKYFRLPVEES